jgi:hypothetical protein
MQLDQSNAKAMMSFAGLVVAFRFGSSLTPGSPDGPSFIIALAFDWSMLESCSEKMESATFLWEMAMLNHFVRERRDA